MAAKDINDPEELRTIPRHFKQHHNCDPTGFLVRGIDRIYPSSRGGDLLRTLAMKETKWITILDTVQPMGLNESVNFGAFLLIIYPSLFFSYLSHNTRFFNVFCVLCYVLFELIFFLLHSDLFLLHPLCRCL